MAEYVFTLRNVRKAHGDKVVLDNVTLSFLHGAKIGVVGPNGMGKSSLLKLMAGLDQPNNGDIVRDPEATVGMLQQEPPLSEGKSVLENVEEAVAEIMAKKARLDEVYAAMGEPDADIDALSEEAGNLQSELDAANVWDLESRLEQAMDALRCPPPDVLVDNLSGGERRRVALCKLLLQQPDLLLLDEPTNHLDAESVQWLEGHLKSYPGAVLAVTHDRYFLDNVAQWIAEVDRGSIHGYEGNYSTYLETKKERLKVEGAKDAKRAKMLEKELEWVRSNAKARQTKSKSRLARYEELAAEADKARKIDSAEINIPPGPRLGDVVLEAKNLTKGYDDRILWNDISFSLPRAGIVGVVGPNGVGKTTLFRMITGGEKPDSGELVVGQTVKISYVDQSRGGIDPNKNVWEVVSDGLDFIKVANFEMNSRAYVASFGFKGPDQQKKAGVLSGGERNRLNLALTLKQRPRRRDPVLAGGRAARLPGLCRGHLARPVVPRPGRHPHPRLGGHGGERGRVVLVRGQLRVVRGEQGGAPRHRGGPAAPGHPPPPHPRLTSRGSC
jgi:ATP-binding cassette ChvD family protein